MSYERVASCCVCCRSERFQRAPAVLMPFVAKRAFGWEPIAIDERWGLRDLKSGMCYALCSSLLCSECELLFLDIRFSPKELDRIYNDYFSAEYIAERAKYEPGFDKHAQFLQGTHPGILDVIEAFLQPHIPLKPRILDWGGGTGSNTPFRLSCGSLDIFEISQVPLLEGARRVTAEQALLKTYDLVVSRHVLEHVPFPQQVLQQMASFMQAETLVYVEVPHEVVVRRHSVPIERLHAKHHWHEHINFFSEKSLRALFDSCNLDVVKLESLQTHETITAFCVVGRKR